MTEEGPFFEDFTVGRKVRSRMGRTITDTDNIWFTLLTGNSNQIHFNEDYTRRAFPREPFRGRMVVNGFLTVAIAAGLLVDETSRNGFQLGTENVKFLTPVFHGDTIYSEAQATEVVTAYEAAVREGRGAIRARDRLVDAVHYRWAKKILERAGP